MINYISDIFSFFCEFRKNDSEYIFIFCPIQSEFENEENDQETRVTRGYGKVKGTSTNLNNDGVLKHWKGGEIASCGCCHLIYEDEDIFEKIDLNVDYDSYIKNNLLKSYIENNNRNIGFNKKSSRSDYKSLQESSNATNADSSDSSNEEKDKSEKKSKISKTPSQIEKELNIIDEIRHKNEVLKNKDEEKVPDENTKKNENELSKNNESSTKKFEGKAINKSSDNKNKFLKYVTTDLPKASKVIQKLGKEGKFLSKKDVMKNNDKVSLLRKNSLKQNNQPFLGKINLKTANSNLKSKTISKNVEHTNFSALNPVEDQNNGKDIDNSISSDNSSIKASLESISGINESTEHNKTIEGNDHKISEMYSEKSNSETSDYEHSDRWYEEEEIMFIRDIPTRIRKNSISSLNANIILKDGTLLRCEVVFSTDEEDLSFICNEKIKSVPWNNIKEIFTTKEKLNLVNTKMSLSKDHTLIVALQLADTGNCIPLKFKSNEDRREFIEFSRSVLQR